MGPSNRSLRKPPTFGLISCNLRVPRVVNAEGEVGEGQELN